MAEERVAGYRLVNLKIDVPIRNRLLQPLLACLIIINNQLTAFSQFLDSSMFYLRQALFTSQPHDHDRNNLQVSASRALGGDTGYQTSNINTATFAATDNNARIISPEELPRSCTTSYVLLVENVNQPLPHMRGIPQDLPPSTFRVINIAVGLGDKKFFETLQFLRRSKTQSLKEYLQLFFSFSQYRVDVVKVECVQNGLRWRMAATVMHGLFDMNDSESRDNWILPKLFVSHHELQDRFTFTQRNANENVAIAHLPRRSTPLPETEILSEAQAGPIYGLAMTKQRSLGRLLVLLLFLCLLLGWSIVPFQAILYWPWWELPEDRPVPVGSIRFRFSCECGEQFICDTKQSQVNLAPLVSVLQSRRDTRQHIGGATGSLHYHPTLVEQYQDASHPNDAESKGIEKESSNVRQQPSQHDTPGSNQSQSNDQCDISLREGLRQRRDQRTKDVTQYSGDDDDADVKMFLIVCFPHHLRREIWQTKVTGINDHGLIRRIKKTYHFLRPFWRRLGELRGISNIRLARFELSHTTDGPLVNDIEWKWPKIEDNDWEFTSDYSEGLPVDGLSKLMVHLWVSQGKSQDHSYTNKNVGIASASISTARKHRMPQIEICGPWTSQTLPIEEHQGFTDELRWIDRIRSVRIYFPNYKERLADISNIDGEIGEWLQTGSVDIDFGKVEPHYIFQRTPKKRREPLGIDPNGRIAPIGWGIWIDEDFSVPWYILLVSGLISFGIFLFAIFYTRDKGASVNGWTIGSFMFIPLNMLLTIWVLKTKDSKHPRL